MQRIAAYMGHELLVAATGAEGRKLMQTEHPDLVLLDINLPDVNGLDLARQWRAEHYTTPIVAITSDLIRYTEAQVLQAGCTAFIAKPFATETMKDLFTRFGR
jgi:DNA-binding response OmpR family regulator